MLNTNSPAKTTEITGNGKLLTPEQFAAAASPKVGTFQPSKAEVIRLGTEAMTRLAKGQSWDDWVAVMRVLDIARTTAMLEANTNKPQGPRYRKAIAKWFRVHDEDEVFSAIDKADRSRLLKCFDNLAALSYWRDILMSPEQRLKVTYPPTVFSRWLAWGKNQTGVEQSEGDEPPPDPLPKPELAVVVSGMTDDELRKQLPIAIPFDRFLRVLPLDWRAKIEARLSRRPHAETAEAFIKASEVLRRALSLVKVADAPKTTPPIAASNEKEALAALRGLNTMLVGVGIDEVTIVHQHAKERRCAKQRRRRTA